VGRRSTTIETCSGVKLTGAGLHYVRLAFATFLCFAVVTGKEHHVALSHAVLKK
jgi:hypothetical protein